MTKPLAALAAMLLCAACSNTYRGAAIEGWVVDAQTKQPLEGVIVVVMWELEHGGFHPGQAGALFRKEAVTDGQGRFAFPAWGPMKAERGFMRDATPYIAFFKRGYKTHQVRNQGYAKRQPVPKLWQSEWNGKTVELDRFEGALREYRNELYAVTALYGTNSQCEWEQMPRLTAQLLDLGDLCTEQELSCLPFGIGTLRGAPDAPCSDPDVLREYKREKQEQDRLRVSGADRPTGMVL